MFVVITCPRRILNLPPLIFFGCQNLNIFGDPFFGNWNFFTQQWAFIHSKNFFPSLKNFSHRKTSFSLKIFYTIKNFCVTFHILWRWNFAAGVECPLLAKCYATDGPNQKSHKCVRECFNDYDWLHYDVEDDKVWCFDCTNASRHGTHYTV